jgi:hypothetical protein
MRPMNSEQSARGFGEANPPPDFTTVATVKRLTGEAKPQRRWLTAVLICVVVLGLPAAALLALEGWRQQDIRAAERELEAALAEASAEFPGVTDWRAWYLSRLDGTWGGDKYLDWAERVSAAVEPHSEITAQSDAMQAHLRGENAAYGPLPDEAARQAFLAYTQALAAELDRLLRYDNLSGVPDYRDGFAGESIIPLVRTYGMLGDRALIQALAGDMEGAWRDFERLAELARRRSTPAYLLELMLNVALEMQAHSIFEVLSSRGAPPDSVARFYPWPDSPDGWTQAMEGELAFMIQLAASKDWREHTQHADWFAWVKWDDPGAAVEAFTTAADDLRMWAAGVRHCREITLAVRQGREPPPPPTGAMITYERLTFTRARAQIHRQRANLVWHLRSHEAAGTPLAEVVVDAEAYPDLRVQPLEDGSVEVAWRWTPRVKEGLDASSEYLFEREHPPLRLRPQGQ